MSALSERAVRYLERWGRNALICQKRYSEAERLPGPEVMRLAIDMRSVDSLKHAYVSGSLEVEDLDVLLGLKFRLNA